MWSRQHEHARWNGHKLNILSTSFDGGKRLQVSEIPYADLPHIKVMGTKARAFTFEVVFVGASSLADANALIDNLEANPQGELEHPWLGELVLVFEEHSLSINTKKGLVTLSLKFVRAGNSPSITAAKTVRAKAQADIVESLSQQSFVEEVKGLDVSQINEVQSSATNALTVLVDITNRLNLADDALKDINLAINEAFSAVSSLSTHPAKFAERFSRAVDTVSEGVQAEPDSESEAVDNSRIAQALILGQVKPESPTQHHNVQLVTGAVKMSKDVTNLEANDSFEIALTQKQPEIMESDLSALVASIEERIKETTQVSTQKSIQLYDALTSLKSNVQTQQDKIAEGTKAHRTVQSPHFKSALTIAHDEYTNEKVITKMNALQHPLFIRGDIAVRGGQ
ncbi:DNA circularization N-terminal domain-containing protein [Vibrio neptunius]|uniref:DNA circularization N-terminal domain-containing protein n=1 Tax=Vibrio neptunius TaxID=170651 RepID=UPI0019D1A4A9|nr:DNA circularization N-terminal domain-containing protein [Vibrio neptunius]MBN3574007.1 DNA circularization N-terminal domain-containing protein [Vibrio neptunius]QXX09239.1 DNA circularization N-terminal domain-containing protein [Vibrio neptunius]